MPNDTFEFVAILTTIFGVLLVVSYWLMPYVAIMADYLLQNPERSGILMIVVGLLLYIGIKIFKYGEK